MAFVILAGSSTNCRISELLHFNVQGGIHLYTALMDCRSTVFLLQITPQFFHEVRSEFVGPLLLDQFDRMQLRFLTVRDRDLLLGDHAVNGVIAPG